MTPSRIIPLLESWIELLQSISRVHLDVEAGTDVLDQRIEERQRAIDAIQQLDASLRSVAELRDSGWPGIDVETRIRAEGFISQGKALCETVLQSDRQVIEITKEKRKQILTRLKTVGQKKGYLSSARSAAVRPPVILDDNA